jgi:hypothetical protein
MLRRVLLSVAMALALASVPAAAELATGTVDQTSSVIPSKASPRADLHHDALRPSTPALTASNVIRRDEIRFACFVAAVAAILAAAAGIQRRPRPSRRSPLRAGRSWASPPPRAPPAIA